MFTVQYKSHEKSRLRRNQILSPFVADNFFIKL